MELVLPKYPILDSDEANLLKNFSYHPPMPGQTERYTLLRAEAQRIARTVLSNCPAGRERSLALTKIEEAVMWAVKHVTA